MNRIFIAFLLLLPFGLFAQEKSADEDFFGDDSATVTVAPTSTADATKLFTETAEGIRWGGTVTSSATWNGGWVDQNPDIAALDKGWREGLDYSLSTKLFLDGRPDKDFRFRLSLKTGYPFTNDTKVVVPTSTGTTTGTLQTPNIKVWEMFTDVTLVDTVFLRFGKQSAGWGVSYFYSPGDVISLTAKDAADPTAEREGPLALKATVPFPGLKANLTGFVLARETYFAGDLPSIRNLGYALQGDILVGEAQLSLGGFYQKDNAPKAVATINTGFGFLNLPVMSDVNFFSEAVVSYGSDVLKGTGSAGSGGSVAYAKLQDWEKSLYYTGTAGASYSNSEGNWSLRAEYLYNPFGSNDKDTARRAYNTFFASTYAGQYAAGSASNSAGRAYGYGDAATPGMHNLTGLFSLSKLAGSDKLSFSTLWQQNLSDGSGWVKPAITFKPWDVITFTWGITAVYGDGGTQYPLTFQYRDKNGTALGPKNLTLNLGVTFGTGKY